MSAETNMQFLAEHREALGQRLAEHLLLTGVTILGAFIIGVTLAIFAFRKPALRTPLLVIVGMLQTIPGIALLVMAMAVFQRIGTVPALAALLLYALLPIVQNTLVGLTSLSPTLSEAARGLGLSKWHRLRYVRLPLAMPMMMAGLRTSAVQTVGLATLAAFVGGGGLGQFINRGLFLSDTRLILLGAVPAALMALMIYAILGLLTKAVTPGIPRKKRRLNACCAMAILAVLTIFTLVELAKLGSSSNSNSSITIGSKNFTEQLIVAEMVAQQLERTTQLKVNRRFSLGGSQVMQQALNDGTIDLGVEYTGTALASILHLPVPHDPASVLPTVREAYQKQFKLVWLPPLGFDNSYRLAVRSNDTRLTHITTISQLTPIAPQLSAAFDFEFAERDDGYKGLAHTYGLHFQHVADMHPDLLYPALRASNTDVISAYATDGRLATPGIRTLTDDAHFFPPYEAAIVVRAATLTTHPELKAALLALSGTVTNQQMQKLNADVDAKQLTVEQAATRALALKNTEN